MSDTRDVDINDAQKTLGNITLMDSYKYFIN